MLLHALLLAQNRARVISVVREYNDGNCMVNIGVTILVGNLKVYIEEAADCVGKAVSCNGAFKELILVLLMKVTY